MISAGAVQPSARATWSGAALVLVVCVPLAVAGALATAVDPAWIPIAGGFALIALAALVRPIEPAPGEKFSLAGAVMFLGALVVPGLYAVVALTAAAVAAKLIQRASFVNLLVNSSKVAGAVGAVAVVTDLVRPLAVAQVVVGGLAYLAVTLGTVALMIASTQGPSALWPFLRREWLQNAGLISVGGAAALMWARDPLGLVLLVPPLALIEIAARARSRERVATEALRKAHESQRAFAADAAHELRTPLATLVGDLAYIRAHALPADEATALEGARREGGRLGMLVDRLLTLSRTEAMPVPSAPTRLASAVDAVLRGIELRIGVELTQDVPDDVHVAMAPELLETVLRDVIGNAAAYTKRGSIHVSAHARVPTLVELAVTDTGIGMTEDEISRVFDRFYRGARARTLAPGTGLGLAIARRIVEGHRGRISITSAEGRGTGVTLALPRG